jgi:hypothetical protein
MTSESRRTVYFASIAMAIMVVLLMHWSGLIWTFWVWLWN